MLGLTPYPVFINYVDLGDSVNTLISVSSSEEMFIRVCILHGYCQSQVIKYMQNKDQGTCPIMQCYFSPYIVI